MSGQGAAPPILRDKDHAAASAFTPDSLLREARRQRGMPLLPVPAVCLLDPDGDIVRRLRAEGRARRHAGWACYHSVLDEVELDGLTVGIIGCAVGAPFAVLVAEQLFASGCRLLVSISSAGQIVEAAAPPYLVLIERALRDEGTSYHYLPPSDYVDAPKSLLAALGEGLGTLPEPVLRGASWTTDAPFRETASAIDTMRRRGILAVEMEAAALYAFAEARQREVICFAHVTNQMGRVEGDFEKGPADGTAAALALVAHVARRLAAVVGDRAELPADG